MNRLIIEAVGKITPEQQEKIDEVCNKGWHVECSVESVMMEAGTWHGWNVRKAVPVFHFYAYEPEQEKDPATGVSSRWSNEQ